MNKNGEWSAARRLFIILMDVIVYNVSIYFSFLLKFGGEIPVRNFQTFESSALFISLFFIILNVLLGAYVFYNRIVSDIVFVTVIGQFLMSLGIMIITFAVVCFSENCDLDFFSFRNDIIDHLSYDYL